MANYQAPDIIEYIHIKDKHKKLQQSIHTWERKVGVAKVNYVLFSLSGVKMAKDYEAQYLVFHCISHQALVQLQKNKYKKLHDIIPNNGHSLFCFHQMALKTHTKAWNKQRATLTPANSAEAGARTEEHLIPVKLPYIAEHST